MRWGRNGGWVKGWQCATSGGPTRPSRGASKYRAADGSGRCQADHPDPSVSFSPCLQHPPSTIYIFVYAPGRPTVLRAGGCPRSDGGGAGDSRRGAARCRWRLRLHGLAPSENWRSATEIADQGRPGDQSLRSDKNFRRLRHKKLRYYI